MSKTYREFIAEVAKPVAGDEINFLNKHVTILLDYPIDVEDQFTGGDISKFTRLADYKNGQDAKVYEDNVNLEDNAKSKPTKQVIIKKIIDENAITDANVIGILESLSDENVLYAEENGIDLYQFVLKLSD